MAAGVARPSDEQAHALHQRLLSGDPVAPADLAEAYLVWLESELHKRYPHIDADLRSDAAERAILSLIRRPASFDPTRMSLERYLVMSADADLRSLLQRERRRAEPLPGLRLVELRPDGEEPIADDNAEHDPQRVLSDADMEPWMVAALEGLSSRERDVVELMMSGERRTAVYAEILGIGMLTPAEQAAEVKRAKDRLTVRLRRAKARAHDERA